MWKGKGKGKGEKGREMNKAMDGYGIMALWNSL